MSWLGRFLRSTIGQKIVMAISGLMLVGFVIAHMIGNLQIFIPDGGEALNTYAALLQGNQSVLWMARLGLLGATHLVEACHERDDAGGAVGQECSST